MNGSKWQAGALGDVKQRMLAIGQIQDPKTGVNLLVDRITAGAAIQISLAELGLAAEILVAIRPVVF